MQKVGKSEQEVVITVEGKTVPLREFISSRAKLSGIELFRDNRLVVKDINYVHVIHNKA